MLAVLKDTPRDEKEWQRWAFHNKDQLDKIRGRILDTLGVKLVSYIVFPFSQDTFDFFLQNNQEEHRAFCQELNIPQSDLLNFDEQNPSDWIYRNYQELWQASLKLGILT